MNRTMKRDLSALKPLAEMLVLFAVVIAALAGLVSQGVTEFIVPPPETTAEQFVSALKAHRYEAARDQLSDDLKQTVEVGRLREAVLSLEEQAGGIEDVQEGEAEKEGQSATAQTEVKLGSGDERVLEFPLRQENGLWKLTSIDPLLQLAGG